MTIMRACSTYSYYECHNNDINVYEQLVLMVRLLESWHLQMMLFVSSLCISTAFDASNL